MVNCDIYPFRVRSKQLSLLPKISLEHGGSLGAGHRKKLRPIDPKRPIHVVLRSSRATGAWSFLRLRHKKQVHRLLERTSKRFQIRVYRYANSGNHIHLLVQCRKREHFQNFLRLFSGQVAFAITGAKKKNPVGRFWNELAYTCIVNWGRHYENVRHYLAKNVLESVSGNIEAAWRILHQTVIPPPIASP